MEEAKTKIKENFFVLTILILVAFYILSINVFASEQDASTHDNMSYSEIITAIIVIAFAIISAFMVHNDAIKHGDPNAGWWALFALLIPVIGIIAWLLVGKNSKNKNINIDSFDITRLKITKNTVSLGILEYFMWMYIFLIMIFLPISEYFNSTFVDNILGGMLFLVLFIIAPICSYGSILTRPLLKDELKLSRVKKFMDDVRKKMWGKEIEEVVKQHSEPFEKQDESTIHLFESLIEDKYGIRISPDYIRWVWEEILKTLELRKEEMKRKEEEMKKRSLQKIRRKKMKIRLMKKIRGNINPSIYSLVEEYKGNFLEGRKKFTEELIKICEENEIDYEVAKQIWDEIAKKIIEEKTEKIKKNLSKGKHFQLLYMVYTNGGLWMDKYSEIKETFLSYLRSIYDMKISEREASVIWNWISKHTEEEIQEMMRKGIDLLMEIEKLGDEEASTRINAAIKLGILGDKRAVRPLLEVLKDRDIEVKVAAAEALGEIGDTRSIDDIRKLLTDIEKEINKIDKKIGMIKNKLEKENKKVDKNLMMLNKMIGDSRIFEFEREIFELEKEIKEKIERKNYYCRFYLRVERVLKHLKKKKFQQIAKLAEGKYKELDWQDFQDRIIEALNGIPSNKKVADMGIDGFTSDGIPIQVKQSERVGRNVVDNFETALRRYYQDTNKKLLEGIIVAFSFTKGAYEEAKRARLDDIKIDLITVDELL